MTLAERLRARFAESALRMPALLDGDPSRGPDRPDPVPAAVLVPVVDRAEPGLLLTLRTETLRKHAGQVAFPGGRIDPEDSGPVAAALREAEEEIGLQPGDVELVGPIDRYVTGTGYTITPVVGVIPPDLALTPHDLEVAAIFEVPLAFVLDPSNHVERAVEWQGRQRRYFEMNWEDRRIWGATAGMIVNLGRRLAER